MSGLVGISQTYAIPTMAFTEAQQQQLQQDAEFEKFQRELQDSSHGNKQRRMRLAAEKLRDYIEKHADLQTGSTIEARKHGFTSLLAKISNGSVDVLAVADVFEKLAFTVMYDSNIPVAAKALALNNLYMPERTSPFALCSQGTKGSIQTELIKLNAYKNILNQVNGFAQQIAEYAFVERAGNTTAEQQIHLRDYIYWLTFKMGLATLREIKIYNYAHDLYYRQKKAIGEIILAKIDELYTTKELIDYIVHNLQAVILSSYQPFVDELNKLNDLSKVLGITNDEHNLLFVHDKDSITTDLTYTEINEIFRACYTADIAAEYKESPNGAAVIIFKAEDGSIKEITLPVNSKLIPELKAISNKSDFSYLLPEVLKKYYFINTEFLRYKTIKKLFDEQLLKSAFHDTKSSTYLGANVNNYAPIKVEIDKDTALVFLNINGKLDIFAEHKGKYVEARYVIENNKAKIIQLLKELKKESYSDYIFIIDHPLFNWHIEFITEVPIILQRILENSASSSNELESRIYKMFLKRIQLLNKEDSTVAEINNMLETMATPALLLLYESLNSNQDQYIIPHIFKKLTKEILGSTNTSTSKEKNQAAKCFEELLRKGKIQVFLEWLDQNPENKQHWATILKLNKKLRLFLTKSPELFACNSPGSSLQDIAQFILLHSNPEDWSFNDLIPDDQRTTNDKIAIQYNLYVLDKLLHGKNIRRTLAWLLKNATTSRLFMKTLIHDPRFIPILKMVARRRVYDPILDDMLGSDVLIKEVISNPGGEVAKIFERSVIPLLDILNGDIRVKFLANHEKLGIPEEDAIKYNTRIMKLLLRSDNYTFHFWNASTIFKFIAKYPAMIESLQEHSVSIGITQLYRKENGLIALAKIAANAAISATELATIFAADSFQKYLAESVSSIDLINAFSSINPQYNRAFLIGSERYVESPVANVHNYMIASRIIKDGDMNEILEFIEWLRNNPKAANSLLESHQDITAQLVTSLFASVGTASVYYLSRIMPVISHIDGLQSYMLQELDLYLNDESKFIAKYCPNNSNKITFAKKITTAMTYLYDADTVEPELLSKLLTVAIKVNSKLIKQRGLLQLRKNIVLHYHGNDYKPLLQYIANRGSISSRNLDTVDTLTDQICTELWRGGYPVISKDWLPPVNIYDSNINPNIYRIYIAIILSDIYYSKKDGRPYYNRILGEHLPLLLAALASPTPDQVFLKVVKRFFSRMYLDSLLTFFENPAVQEYLRKSNDNLAKKIIIDSLIYKAFSYSITSERSMDRVHAIIKSAIKVGDTPNYTNFNQSIAKALTKYVNPNIAKHFIAIDNPDFFAFNALIVDNFLEVKHKATIVKMCEFIIAHPDFRKYLFENKLATYEKILATLKKMKHSKMVDVYSAPIRARERNETATVSPNAISPLAARVLADASGALARARQGEIQPGLDPHSNANPPSRPRNY
jgi:hypothetical protein